VNIDVFMVLAPFVKDRLKPELPPVSNALVFGRTSRSHVRTCVFVANRTQDIVEFRTEPKKAS
jgi:hypothetical protein